MNAAVSMEERVQHCSICGDDRQVGERILVCHWTLPRGRSSCELVETWATVARVEPVHSGRAGRFVRNHVSRVTVDGEPFRPDCMLGGCVCADRELSRAPRGMTGIVTTSDGATYRVIDAAPADEDGLVLVECIAGDAPRHVPGRRVMMPAEQLRRAA